MSLITPPIRAGEEGSSRHHFWGRVPSAADLPNVAGSPSQSPPIAGTNVLEPGDVCWSNAEQCLYVCIVETQGAAIWRCLATRGGPGGGSILFWGNDRMTASATRQYLHPGYVAEATPILLPTPEAGVIRDMTIYFNSPYTPPPPTRGSLDFILQVNGVDSALSITGVTGDTAVVVSNNVAAVPVAQGDLLSVAVDKNIDPGPPPDVDLPERIVCTFRWT
jgi:hypothetical protein